MRAINADVLLEELKESSKHHAENSREEQLLYRDRVIVREQPTLDIKLVVKGYWIDHSDEDGISLSYTCSSCGMDNLWESPFCPNCGADMRGEIEE